MYCQNCGKEMSDSLTICPNCGWIRTNKIILTVSKIVSAFIKVVLLLFVIFVIGYLIYNFPKAKGKIYEFNDIEKVKLVTEYSQNTKVENIDTVKFGTYLQSNAKEDMNEPIEWIVLERQKDKALLLSKYILDCKSYNDIEDKITWEYSTLRAWLNTTFYLEAFNNTEQNTILAKKNLNKENLEYGATGGNDTVDKVFLLSVDEVNKYFSQKDMQNENKKLATKGTEYAKSVNNKGYNLRVFDSSRWYGGNSSFWLRSPGFFQNGAVAVYEDGYLDTLGLIVTYNYFGVRPAIWVSY